jgi:hypothetical protein
VNLGAPDRFRDLEGGIELKAAASLAFRGQVFVALADILCCMIDASV